MRFYLPVLLVVILALGRFISVCVTAKDACLEVRAIPEMPLFRKIRLSSIDIVDSNFPSPHSELLLGMLIGLDRLGEVPYFSQSLRDTSTIHVVVVSGFNIALVFGLVTKTLGSEYKFKNLLIAQAVTVFYALLSGFEPPVVRALVMGSVVAWGKYYGRVIDGLRVLLFAGSLMVIIDPAYLASVSFQLSFMASLGLILFSKIFKNLKVPEDLKSTFSAQMLVWPIISVYFGRVSLIGFIVNPLILWTVPVSTVLGGIFLLAGFISPLAAQFLSIILYPFLDIFFKVVMIFGGVPYTNMDFKISPFVLTVYYLLIFLCTYIFAKRAGRKNEPENN
jgi:competence protein ComEC